MVSIEASQTSRESATAKNLALVALVVALIGFALTPNFVRLSEIGPIATGFWRALLAAPLLLALHGYHSAHRTDAPQHIRPRDVGWLLVASLGMAGDLILFQSAVHHTSIANAALIGSLFPVIATLGAWLLFGERITPVFLLGLVIALSGTSFLVYAGGTPLQPVALGDYFAAGSAFSFAAYVLGLKQLRGRFSTATVMMWNLGVSACLLLPLAIIQGEDIFPPSLYGWIVLIAFALVVDVIGRTSYTFSFARLTASFIAVGMLIVPGVAAAIAWVLFSESLSLLQVVAALLALAGIGIARHGQVEDSTGAVRRNVVK